MLTVQRVGSETNVDTSGLAKTSELDEALLSIRSEVSYRRWRLVVNTVIYWGRRM